MFDDLLPRLFAEMVQRSWESRQRIAPHVADHVVVGKVVRVTDRILPGRLGSVLIPIRGGTEEYFARSRAEVAIPAGQMVEVVAYAPPRTVDVKPVGGITLSKHPTPES